MHQSFESRVKTKYVYLYARRYGEENGECQVQDVMGINCRIRIYSLVIDLFTQSYTRGYA